MAIVMLPALARLSNAALLAEVKRLAQREREATAALVAHLAELDARRLYLAEGCSSLFTYATQVLHLSEHAAYGRIEVARVARRFPLVLERLAEGSVTLTAVTLLAPHLTAENHRALLDAARHASRRAVEALVARLRPQPPVPASVRKLPPPRPVTAPPLPAGPATRAELAPEPAPPDAAARLAAGGQRAPAKDSPAPTLPLAGPPPRPPVVAPLAPERYRVQFTASAETYAKLRLAQDLLRHQIPDGDVGQVLDRALTALVEQLTKQKLAATDRPRGSRGTAPGSRHVPAEVKRAVWRRDGGRCAFSNLDGRRCTERGRLEYHHVRPYAAGGAATVENIRLRCRAHNAFEAEREFGPGSPWRVREPAGAYGTSGPARSWRRRTRSGPSGGSRRGSRGVSRVGPAPPIREEREASRRR